MTEHPAQHDTAPAPIPAAAERDRLRRREAADHAAVATSLARLAAVLEGDPARLVIERDAEPLYAATRLVCQQMGIPLSSLPAPRTVPDPTAAERQSQLVSRLSGLRVRQVALRGAWWQGDHGPLLGYWEADRRPVALLPTSPSSYEAFDPGTGSRERVTAEVAGRLSSFAGTLYRRLPPRPLGGWDVLRFSAFGSTWDLLTICLMGILAGLLGMITPRATGLLFDTIIPGAARGQLAQVAIGLAVAAAATSLFDIVKGFAIVRLEGRTSAALQAAVWDRLLDLPAHFFQDYSSGDLAVRAFGIETMQRTLAATTLSTIMSALFALFNLYQVFDYGPGRVPLYAMGLVLIAVLVTLASGAWQLRLQRPLVELQGRLSGLVLQLLNGIAKLRVSGAEGRAFCLWARDFAVQRRLALQVRAPLAVFQSVYPIVSAMVLYYVLLRPALGPGDAPSPLSTGTFTAFIAAFGAFMEATLETCGALLSVLEVGPVWARLRPIFAAKPEIDESKGDPGQLTGEIELAHVSFRYREGGPLILNDLSLRVRPGEFVALVGASGSGKSTLLRLLLGFERPAEGTIYYNGQDLGGLDVRELRRQIGVVLQNGKLMTGSILDNIIGASNLTPEDAMAAARMAGLDDDLSQMAMGLHTIVSEGGSMLSGGQRQRLMIARALVRRPRILFFDEATSALDNRTQAVVKASIDQLAATRVVIAHRLSTVLHADRIVVLDQGRLVQSGTYQELMAQQGPFAELARRQLM